MTIIWICGLLSQRISLEFGFGAMVFSSLAAVLLFAGNYRNLVNEEKKSALAGTSGFAQQP